MFEFIKGTLVEIYPTHAVVETGGIGYLIHIPLSTFTNAPKLGEKCQFFLTAIYREDSQRLFGFTEREERELFLKVSDISGIGPKTALALIGHLSVSDLIFAVQHHNAKLISQVPGIGKKTAERLIVELQDKIKGLKPKATRPSAIEDHQSGDALSALLNLGYSLPVAQKAVEKAKEDATDDCALPQLITKALKFV
ncbi:MAG: Holliday junction branch migration protein RuvA [Simkaniaceae bacterium]|nr:Holliday junction branch migration protein RuvA [Simkaniaceae bacterium]